MSDDIRKLQEALMSETTAGKFTPVEASNALLLLAIVKQLERIADALERAADDAGELVQ